MWPFTKKAPLVEKPIVPTLIDYIGWRNNMWVMTPDGIGIVFKLGKDCEVHLTDSDGYTMQSKVYSILALRQATFDEIPKARRGFTRTTAFKLGYK